jgi:O-antigen biosynthesis protein
MAERAHPEDKGFKDHFFGLKKNKYRKKLYERYNFVNTYVKGKEVLDIPCGVGWGSSLLTNAKSVIGIDISKEAVDDAKRIYGKKGIEFKLGNMAKIPLETNSIDVISCLEGFEHVERAIGEKFIQESKRVLRNNGLLIMTCPVLDEHGKDTGNQYHLVEYPEEDLIKIINENYRIILLERIIGPDGPEYRGVFKNFKDRRYI